MAALTAVNTTGNYTSVTTFPFWHLLIYLFMYLFIYLFIHLLDFYTIN